MRSKFTKKDLVESANRATVNAVKKTTQSGGSVTFQVGKRIIKQYPDGQRVVLQELDKAYVRVTKKRYKIA